MIRDPDLVQIIDKLQTDLDALKANVVSRWGRVPHVPADPAALVDGMVWIRSGDLGLRFRANGQTVTPALGYVTQLSDASDHVTSGTTELTVLTNAVVLIAGRRYELTLTMHTGLTVATDQFTIRGYIAAQVPLVAIAPSVSANQIVAMTSQASSQVAGGSTTIKVTVQRNAGTGTCAVSGAAFQTTLLTVKDIGT